MPAPATRRRPFRVLPPITRGSESLEGCALLEEVPGDAGVLLWQSLRNVTLWAAAPPEARRTLFSRTAAARRAEDLARVRPEEALREPMAAVAELLRAPVSTPPARVAAACEAVSRWAEGRGAGATALAFMQAAALAEPTDAARAHAAGQLARQGGETVRAEGWLQKAVVLARQNGDWATYARAYLALGNLAFGRGNLPQARRMHTRALRAAERYRMRELQGRALHDLMVVAVEYGDRAGAVRLASEALRAYGPGHANVRYLAHDVACVWSAQGRHERALRVFRAALAHFPAPADRALVLANLAWAAGMAGRRDEYHAAADEALRRVRSGEGDRFAAQVLLNVARGAAGVGDAATAAGVAREAAEAAGARSEAKILALAEALLEQAGRDAVMRGPGREEPGREEEGEETSRPADELAAELVRSLAASAPAA